MVRFVLTYGLLCYLHACLMGQATFGQDQPIAGRLINKHTGTAIHQVLISNTHSSQYVLSDQSGKFAISAHIGDTLRFTKVGYKTFTQVLTALKPLHIELEDNTILLDEVNITAKSLTPTQTLTLRKKEYRSIYLKGDNKRFVQVTPLGIAISINRTFSALSKEGKDARRLQRTFVRDYENSIVDERFNKKLVQNITGLNGTALDDFIMENRPSYGWVINASDYDMIQYIKERM